MNVQRDSRQHEWEIISSLYKNKFVNVNEFDMIGFMDNNVMENWSSNFVDEDTSNCSMNFISQKWKVNAFVTTECLNNYSFESLAEKQKITYNKILKHYRGGGHKEPEYDYPRHYWYLKVLLDSC